MDPIAILFTTLIDEPVTNRPKPIMQGAQRIALMVMAVGLIFHIVGYVLITNVTLHRNLIYLLVALPFCAYCLSSLREIRTPISNLKISFSVAAFLILTSVSALWGSEHFVFNALLYSFYVASFMGAIVIVLSDVNSITLERFLILAPLLTATYIAVVSGAFLFAATGNVSSLESLLTELGVDGFGYLRDVGYVRSNWSHEIPRLDVGSNDLSNPVSAAMYFGFMFLMLLFYDELTDSRPNQKLVIYAVAIILIFGMVMTQSRAPLFSLVFTLTIFLFLKLPRRDYGILGFSLVMLTTSAVMTGLYFDDLRLFQFNEHIRLEIASACVTDARANPIFGIGFQLGNSPFNKLGLAYQHCHNIFLDTLRLGGLVGLVSLILVLFFAFQSALKDRSNLHFLVPPLVFGLLCLQTDGTIPLSKPNVHWLLLWLPIALIVLHDRSQGTGRNLFNSQRKSPTGN